MDTDHAFAELGLPPGATPAEVKAAWRRLVSRWHPDRNDHRSAVARMQRINDAVRVIRGAGFGFSKPPAGQQDAARAEAPSPDARSHHDADTDPQRRVILRKLKLTLEEAASGCTKVIQGQVTDNCATCSGRGFRLPGGPCKPCDGTGEMRQAAWFGWVHARTACEACAGSGESRLPCPDCDQTGKQETRRYRFTVRIPPGARSGDLLHVDGRRARAGLPPVDLRLRVDVPKHALFELDSDGTVRCEMPVDGFTWIANRSIRVPSLAGLQPLQLSRDRLSYRLKHQGFPVERGGPCGDQIVTVRPIFPEKLSTDQEILLDQLIAASTGPDGQPTDDRLRTWNQTLRTSGKSRSKR